MEKIKNFWDLDWQEREKIVSQTTKGQKWVVWDYFYAINDWDWTHFYES
jgi:hypothetical protein